MEEKKRRPGRPPKKTEFGREFLLTNALIEFAKNGYEGTSLRTIASLSNVDVALIAHHYGSKLDLWKAVVDYLASLVITRAPFNSELSLKGQEDIHMKIETFIDDLVHFSFEYPYHGMFLAHEAVSHNERSEYLVNKLLNPTFIEIKPFIEECMRIGAVREQKPVIFFLMLLNSVSLLATMHHYVSKLSEDLKQVESFKEEMKRSVAANFYQTL